MIYLIITTSINNKHGVINDTHRKKTYIQAITTTLNHIKDINIKPIIVENNGFRSTYLDNLGCDILYTNNNDLQTPHKGVNELQDIKDVIDKYNIQDDDMIIKLTGRYTPLKDTFFKNVINSKYDALLKFFHATANIFKYYDCVLGFFAIKCKYIKQFKYECKTSPEVEFATFVRNTIDKNKIEEIMYLDLQCCFADNLHVLNL